MSGTMRIRRPSAAGACVRILVLVASICSLAATAQDMEPYQEYDKKIRSAEQIGPLSDDLFGDQVNVYDQATVFRYADIDIPGSNALPVTLARKLVIRPLPAPGIPPQRYAGAGDWDIDVPFISGVFDSGYGWNVGTTGAQPRCSTNFYPKTTAPSRIENIWSGYTVNLPGSGARTLIGMPAPQFVKPDSATRLWTTSSMDTVSCTPMLGGYPGEGFVLETTEGVKYFFNVGTVRTVLAMRSVNVRPRIEVYLLASRMEDRFGNWVAYTYNATGHPTIIEGSDGRRIDLTYSGDQLISASAHGRTWVYGYSGASLVSVTLPDTSLWRFTHVSDMRVVYERWTEDPGPGCSVLPPLALKEYVLQIQHPSGALGTFRFEHKRNFRTGIPWTFCQAAAQPDHTVTHYLDVPFHFDTFALASKTIQGAGIPTPLVWSYADTGGDDGGLWSGTVPPCLTCPASKLVTIQQPDGSTVTERYGTVYALNEGKLLERQISDTSGVLSAETLNYLSDAEVGGQPFPDRYGSLWGGNDDSAVKIRPLKSKTVVQDGVSFQWAVNGFDAWGRAIRVTKSSTLPGNPSRTEATAYSDNLSQWILGQVAQVTCTASTPASAVCDGGTGSVMSLTSYDPTWALPLVSQRFGRTVQILGYDTSSLVSSGQRGTLRTVTDGNGNVTTLTNWKRGIPQSIKYPGTPEVPSGATQSAAVNDWGWIISVTDENGFSTGYDYDDMGRLALIDYPNSDTVDWFNTTLTFEPVASAEYGIAAGHWRQTTSTGNARKVSYFDALWRPLVVHEYDTVDVAGTQRFTRFTYDHEGRTTFAAYPGTNDALTTGAWTYYDALGRPVQSTQDSELGPLTTTTEYLTGFKTRMTPPRGQGQGAAFQITTSYLAWDQPTTDFPTAITHPAGAFTDIARDVFGKPTAITRRNSSASITLSRNYVYDAKQLLCKAVEPETGATIMDYDGAGNLQWNASGLALLSTTSCDTLAGRDSGRKVTRLYDARNRVATLSFPDGKGDQAWTYTSDGLPATIVTNNANGGDTVANSYVYNKRRLPVSETVDVDGQQWITGYGYDANGNLASHVYPEGMTISYNPNALGQPTQAGSHATGVSYFPNGAIKQFTYGNGIVHALTQNARGLPERNRDAFGATAVHDDSLDFDFNGNVAAISDGLPGARGNRDMTYDALDRLTSVVSPMFGTATYTYDLLDNLQAVRLSAGPKIRDHLYIYDASNRLSNVTNAGGATVVGLSYDPQGNLANKNGALYRFDYGNRLREVTDVEQYRYDGHGRRVQALRNGASIFSVYGQDGVLRFQRDERIGKRSAYVYLAGSLVAQVENPIPLATPLLTVPGYSGNGSYTVSWTSAAVATKYQLQERLGGGAWSTVHDAAGTSKAIAGKAAGSYGYQVRACSATACGSWSVVATVTVQLPPSGVPTLSVPATGLNGSYPVSWTSVAAADTYQLQERLGSGAWSTVHDAAATSKAVSGKATGNWSYQVRACNAAGCGAYSAIATVQVVHPPASAPTLTVPATNYTGGYSISWTAVSTSTHYELEERVGTGAWSQIHNAAQTSKSVSGKPAALHALTR
jgi:YD repeat-containing protein